MNPQYRTIPLSQLVIDSANPNTHSDEKIKLLADNIEEFGLINALLVTPNGDDTFLVVAGVGRLLACQSLGWTEIPCQVLDDADAKAVSGKRTSENKLRSFNWPNECRSYAEMRRAGWSAEEIAGKFGYKNANSIRNMIAAGEIPDLIQFSLNEKIDIDDCVRHILPLRIQISRTGLKGADREYDYTVVHEALSLLSSGTLSRGDLPQWSADRRVMIAEQRLQQEREAAAAEAAKQVAERNERAIKEHEAKAAKLAQALEAARQREEAKLAEAEVKKKVELEQQKVQADREVADLKREREENAAAYRKLYEERHRHEATARQAQKTAEEKIAEAAEAARAVKAKELEIEQQKAELERQKTELDRLAALKVESERKRIEAAVREELTESLRAEISEEQRAADALILQTEAEARIARKEAELAERERKIEEARAMAEKDIAQAKIQILGAQAKLVEEKKSIDTIKEKANAEVGFQGWKSKVSWLFDELKTWMQIAERQGFWEGCTPKVAAQFAYEADVVVSYVAHGQEIVASNVPVGED